MNGLETFQLEAAERVGLAKTSLPEGLRERVGLLEPGDQLLLELALGAATPHRRMAAMLGVEPGTISRRLRKLGARIHDPIVTRLLDRRCPLGPDYRQVGVEHFLAGRTIAQIAARLGRSHASVRQTISHVRAWRELTRAAGRAPAER